VRTRQRWPGVGVSKFHCGSFLVTVRHPTLTLANAENFCIHLRVSSDLAIHVEREKLKEAEGTNEQEQTPAEGGFDDLFNISI
jgi:hypothetical protein